MPAAIPVYDGVTLLDVAGPAESMRRVFARKLSMSPAAYQRRFKTASHG